MFENILQWLEFKTLKHEKILSAALINFDWKEIFKPENGTFAASVFQNSGNSQLCERNRKASNQLRLKNDPLSAMVSLKLRSHLLSYLDECFSNIHPLIFEI